MYNHSPTMLVFKEAGLSLCINAATSKRLEYEFYNKKLNVLTYKTKFSAYIVMQRQQITDYLQTVNAENNILIRSFIV